MLSLGNPHNSNKQCDLNLSEFWISKIAKFHPLGYCKVSICSVFWQTRQIVGIDDALQLFQLIPLWWCKTLHCPSNLWLLSLPLLFIIDIASKITENLLFQVFWFLWWWYLLTGGQIILTVTRYLQQCWAMPSWNVWSALTVWDVKSNTREWSLTPAQSYRFVLLWGTQTSSQSRAYSPKSGSYVYLEGKVF